MLSRRRSRRPTRSVEAKLTIPTWVPWRRTAWSGPAEPMAGKLYRGRAITRSSSSATCCTRGFGFPCTPPSSTSFGTSTSTCTSSRRTLSFVCRCTCGSVGPQKIKPSTEGFASAHQVHHQRRTVFEEEGDQSVEKDCQFGCLNFSYKSGVVSPVTAYRNKWPSDWQQH
jgi:hypothetical protein